MLPPPWGDVTPPTTTVTLSWLISITFPAGHPFPLLGQERSVSSLVAAKVRGPARVDFRTRSRRCGLEDRSLVLVGPPAQPARAGWTGVVDSGPVTAFPTGYPPLPVCSSFVTSRLRQSPAYPSDRIQHACLLRVGVPRTSRAVLRRLTSSRALEHDCRRSEDVNSQPVHDSIQATVPLRPNRRPSTLITRGITI